MPRATAITEPIRKDLKTVPPSDGQEGGFVVLRELTWGEKLARRAFTSKALMRGGGGRKRGNFEAEMDLMSEAAQIYSFTHCIIDHNLEDEDGRRLNLSAEGDIKKLSARVGEEIDKYIDELNNFDDESEDDGVPSS